MRLDAVIRRTKVPTGIGAGPQIFHLILYSPVFHNDPAAAFSFQLLPLCNGFRRSCAFLLPADGFVRRMPLCKPNGRYKPRSTCSIVGREMQFAEKLAENLQDVFCSAVLNNCDNCV